MRCGRRPQGNARSPRNQESPRISDLHAKDAGLTTAETPFEIGKAIVLWRSEKSQVTIFTTGPLSYLTLNAAKELERKYQFDRRKHSYAKASG